MSVLVTPQVKTRHTYYRYAQNRGGQRMHLVVDYGHDEVGDVALCGVRPTRGYWRMTCNMPLGHACRRCQRAWRRMQREERVAGSGEGDE